MNDPVRTMAARLATRSALALAIAGAAAGAAAGGLRNDPFTRPHLGPGPAPAKTTSAAPTAAPTAEADPTPPWQPALRGVMQAGDASVANVDGSLVAIGESIDGWRLLRVDDGKALFAKGGKRTLLTMNNAGQQKK